MKKLTKLLLSLSFYVGCAALTIASFSTTSVRESGKYHTKNTVALYLFKYYHLPSNYVTKAEVEDSGKQPRNGRYIGGDVFEYRGAIAAKTNLTNLRECDLSYPAFTNNRGTKRLVYDVNCYEIYYTSDHYEHFTRVTRFSINGFATINYVLAGLNICTLVGYTIYTSKKYNLKTALGELSDSVSVPFAIFNK